MSYEFYITLGFSHKDPIWSCRVRDYDIEDRRGMKRLTLCRHKRGSGVL